jgi:hypothetical protein
MQALDCHGGATNEGNDVGTKRITDCHGGATNEGNDVGTKRITAQQCRDFIYFFYHINNRLININNNASSDESVVSSLVCLFVLFQAL